MRKVLYMGCPIGRYDGDPASLLGQWRARPTWNEAAWEMHLTTYAGDSSLDAESFASRVSQTNGPILLLRPVQNNALTEIQKRISLRVPIFVEEVADLNQLSQAIGRALTSFENGEPTVPRDLAVALMLMYKLDANHMWAGNAKGYMWADDLPKGRGFDENQASRLPLVVSILLKADILTRKTSKSASKYALNPEHRKEIYAMMRNRRFPDGVHDSLTSNREWISARAIDHCFVLEATHVGC